MQVACLPRHVARERATYQGVKLHHYRLAEAVCPDPFL